MFFVRHVPTPDLVETQGRQESWLNPQFGFAGQETRHGFDTEGDAALAIVDNFAEFGVDDMGPGYVEIVEIATFVRKTIPIRS